LTVVECKLLKEVWGGLVLCVSRQPIPSLLLSFSYLNDTDSGCCVGLLLSRLIYSLYLWMTYDGLELS